LLVAPIVRTMDRGSRQVMRYRRSTYRYTMVMHSGLAWPFGDIWQSDRLRLLAQGRWRPDADTYETSTTIEIVVDLAGIDEETLDIQLFEDAIVVAGQRHLPSAREGAVYHAAAIRQGPFQVELPLTAAVDAERVEARYERGLLLLTLPKRMERP
jgi:HSP20 family protein